MQIAAAQSFVKLLESSKPQIPSLLSLSLEFLQIFSLNVTSEWLNVFEALLPTINLKEQFNNIEKVILQ
jgi:hypothetical protein